MTILQMSVPHVVTGAAARIAAGVLAADLGVEVLAFRLRSENPREDEKMVIDDENVQDVTEGVTNILNVHSEIFEQGGKAAFRYDIIVQDRAQIEAVMAAVRKVPDVSSVERAKEFDKS